MKESVRVSLVQFAPAWLERKQNARRMQETARQEAEKGSELILFPELANIGYITPTKIGEPPSFDEQTSAEEFHVKYLAAAEPIPGPTTELLGEVARQRSVYIVVGIAEQHPVIPYQLYNSAVLIGPSGIVGVHRKAHIPNNEKYFFYPGNAAEVYPTSLGNISMTVCYDGRFPEFVRVFALKGAEIHCAIWATADADNIDPHCLRYRAYVRALENNFYFLSCNRVGTEGRVSFLGHSAIAQPSGDILAASDSKEEEIITAELRNDVLVGVRARRQDLRNRRPELYGPVAAPLSPLTDPFNAPPEA
ncbi:MAG: carbon-nitrogen hydrolase family protein [Chloroflexota bacterium]